MTYRLHNKASATLFLSLTICLCVVTPSRAKFGDLLYELTASNTTSPDDNFGRDVAVSGNTVVVGSGDQFIDSQDPQEVYVFDVTTGQERYKLANSDVTPQQGFGFSVAIDGNVFIAGASNRSSVGEAYLFDASTGQKLRRLSAWDTVVRDNFGESVDIHGNKAIVGAFADHHAGEISGAAYLFDVSTGQGVFKLTAADAAERDQFGHSVGISGNIAIVGATSQFAAQNKPGAAYLFDVTTGQQLRKLSASDASPPDNFGQSVAIDGNIAIIGAPFFGSASNPSGYAYLFDVTTGQQLFKLVPSDAAPGDHFGGSVAISGNTAIVGADFNDVTGEDTGAAYLFDVTTGQEILKLTVPNLASYNRFGSSVAIDGYRAIVGANGLGTGAAYVFDVSRIPGDFTNDGTVDAADYIVWRNDLGTTYTQADYDAWRTNFGRTAAGAAAVAEFAAASHTSAHIPEPSAVALFATAAVPGLWHRRNKRKPMRSRKQLTNFGKHFVELAI
jgi:outer membrane protein assembly factor BamB